MRRAVLILAIAALALPTQALGKGPSGATIEGPGADRITFTGGRNSGLFLLTEQTGLFPAVFGREPDPMLDRRPQGDLGPRYVITWTVPGPNNETWKLRQDLYPYADSGPVTYMAPGQEVFRRGTHGGWYQAGARLKQVLVDAGLPARARPSSSADDPVFSAGIVSLLAAAMLLLAAAAVILRRRTRPAARMAGSPS